MMVRPSAGRGGAAARLAGAVGRLCLIVVFGVLISAALVRFSPGFESEESDLDFRVSHQTSLAMRRHAADRAGFAQFLAGYVRDLGRGDLGVSRVFNVPVAELLKERAAATAALIASGVTIAWLTGFVLAAVAVRRRDSAARMAAEATAGLSLAIPPAVIAIEFMAIRAPLGLAMALAILPKVFGVIRELLDRTLASPALVFARGRGVRPWSIVTRYILAPIAPELGSLFGVSIVLAFGAAIPIEALCDVAGLGQLAWRAALGRDLPLLCALAMLVTFTVALAQMVAEVCDHSS